jgi:hypothetical protein
MRERELPGEEIRVPGVRVSFDRLIQDDRLQNFSKLEETTSEQARLCPDGLCHAPNFRRAWH